jgi:hypothetical protein
MLPDRAERVARLEEHRQIALACWPPQVRAANEAAFMQARLLGLVVDQQAVLHANANEPIALTGDVAETRERLVEALSERMGTRKATKTVEFMQRLRDEPDVIEGKVERDDD